MSETKLRSPRSDRAAAATLSLRHADLLEASPEELMALFRTLPAPSIEEMHGEYRASMLTQRSLFLDLLWRFAVYTPFYPGVWVGKAFRPVSESEGRGYNYFRRGHQEIVQRYPMKTLIAPSRYDRKPAYQLVYRAYDSACGRVNMVDEIRRFGEGQYLLIGTAGFTREQRQVDSFFFLEGPLRPYRGDIGTEQAVDLEREIPQWRNPE